jgi:hypothetical protein
MSAWLRPPAALSLVFASASSHRAGRAVGIAVIVETSMRGGGERSRVLKRPGPSEPVTTVVTKQMVFDRWRRVPDLLTC